MNTRWLAPLYAYPGPDSPVWRAFLTLRHVHAVVINPASGYRGNLHVVDAGNWHWAVTQCHRRGIVTIGYLSTKWGSRPREELRAEMDAYRSDFAIDGFFLDETSTALAHLPLYIELRRLIPGMLVLNPGTQIHPQYFRLADVIVTRETDKAEIVPTPDELKVENQCCHILTGIDALRTLQQLQKFPNLGYRWFTEKAGDYTQMPDFIRLLDSELL